MANEFVNPVAVAKESLIRLENNTVLMKFINREFDDKFAVRDEKIGYVYNARLPVRFRGRRGDGMRPEPIREQLVPIPVDTLWGQDLEITDQDLTMTVDRFNERYTEGAVAIIANMIDGDLFDLYPAVFGHVGTPGTIPTTLDTYAQAGAELTNMAVPLEDRSMVISPDMEVKVLGFQANLFNPPKEMAEQYRTGKMGTAINLKWSSAQNVPRQTVGIVASAVPLVDGANQTGSTILTKGWHAGVGNVVSLNRGDIVTFALTNAVNPVSFRDTGRLRTFVVTADTTSDNSGAMTIPISPDLNIDAGTPFQTVMNSPAADAVIKVYGIGTALFTNLSGISTPQALCFHKDWATLVVVKQELPGGMEWSEWAASAKSGLWIRLVRGYDINANKKLTRFDVLGGKKCIRPELCVRVSG